MLCARNGACEQLKFDTIVQLTVRGESEDKALKGHYPVLYGLAGQP